MSICRIDNTDAAIRLNPIQKNQSKQVRVPSYYGGTLSMHAFLTPAGGTFEQRVATAEELEVGIDRTPSNAVGILCQPRAVAPGKPFVINIWFTQTHPRESDLIAVALVSARVFRAWLVLVAWGRGDGCMMHGRTVPPAHHDLLCGLPRCSCLCECMD